MYEKGDDGGLSRNHVPRIRRILTALENGEAVDVDLLDYR